MLTIRATWRMRWRQSKCKECLGNCTDHSVSEPLATPFGYPVNCEDGGDYGGYTSFVQLRGSIPVMWHQISEKMTPKPPIESKLGLCDADHQLRSRIRITLLQPDISTTCFGGMEPQSLF